jgi:arginyl-tRNA synthetase
MTIKAVLFDTARTCINELYGISTDSIPLQVNDTKPEFDGDYTVVLFPLVKFLKKTPEILGQEIGVKILELNPVFTGFNVIKGFLNITVSDFFLTTHLLRHHNDACYGSKALNGKKVMVEFSSPNTNKPLHLGHLRNIFLGWSMHEIFKAGGYEVVKACIVNDRGIHICKSMIAWQLFANGATPEMTNTKGDHFVGTYYVLFNEEYKRQVATLVAGGITETEAEKNAPIMKATQEMLLKWEAGDEAVRTLWDKMNGWVYKGFEETYQKTGICFDIVYYESDTYLLGKETVQEGLETGVFFKKEDGSVWIDLTAEGLDEKLVQRKDGTSVYITQDLGLAKQKYEQYQIDKSIYVVGNEQDYHMAVLKLICKKIGLPYADSIYHLSYGMVELTSGKMKSREGTVVDADDMVADMIQKSKEETAKHGKTGDFTDAELLELYDLVGLGAMKFYLLRVDPKKKMIFNPDESIEFQGFTGPFIQYTHARIRSILRKNGERQPKQFELQTILLKPEKDLLLQLEKYEDMLDQALLEYNPSIIAIYVFEVAKIFNSFYTELSVNNAETEEKKELRLLLCSFTATVIKNAMHILGIKVPERM